MSTGYVIPVDPSELANRFSSDEVEEELEADDTLDAHMENLLGGSGSDYEDRIQPLLDRIPKREADLIYLYYIQKKRQADIASIFGCTQAAISYRLDRGLQRIKFLLAIPQVTEEEMRADLGVCKSLKEIDVNILCGMWVSTCQSEVASRLGLTQGRVRHRFFKAVEKLEREAQEDTKFEPYWRIFAAIAGKGGNGGKKGFNLLHEVKLPQWQGKGVDECL